MIRPGFLDIESRQNLIELARDGSAAHRLARRANALVLLVAPFGLLVGHLRPDFFQLIEVEMNIIGEVSECVYFTGGDFPVGRTSKHQS